MMPAKNVAPDTKSEKEKLMADEDQNGRASPAAHEERLVEDSDRAEVSVKAIEYVFKIPRLEKIYRGLRGIGEGPVADFLSACRFVEEDAGRYPSASRMFGVLVRELEGALRDALLPLALHIAGMEAIPESEENHKTEIDLICRALGLQDHHETLWVAVIAKDRKAKWPGVHGLVHRNRTNAPRALDDVVERRWEMFIDLLEAILEGVNANFLNFVERASEFADLGEPSAQDVKKYVKEIPPNPVLLRHFFGRIYDARWISELHSRGFLGTPPEPRVSEDGSTVVEPWPPSRAIARLAAETGSNEILAPVVVELANSGTENYWVQRDLLEALVRIDPTACQHSLLSMIEWARSATSRMLGDDLGLLAARLARHGFTDESLALLRETLTLESGGEPLSEKEFSELGGLRPEPRSRIDSWEYDQVLERDVPTLVEFAPIETLELLADLLAEGLELSRSAHDGGHFDDYSIIWRPEIPGQGPPHHGGPKQGLVTAVRSAVESIVASDPGQVKTLVELLEARRWTVLRRIALHVLSLAPNANLELAADRITNAGLLRDVFVERELFQLVQSVFPLLQDKQREPYLEHVLGLLTETGKDEDAQGIEERRVLNWLSAAKSYLTPEAGDVLHQLESKYDAQEGAREHFKSGSFWGPTSPVTVDEIAILPVDDLVAFFRNWVPPGDWDSPTPEGLSRLLAEAVPKRAMELSSAARSFIDLEATYVRGLISGFSEAVKQGTAVDWDATLDLCQWLVKQPRAIEGREPSNRLDMDPDRGWARKSVARLVLEGLQPGVATIPIEKRSRVWDLLSSLLDDPDPSREEEMSLNRGVSDAVVSAINSVRGEALRAVSRYGLWVRRWQKEQSDGETLAEAGFDQMPEIREVLDRHLDPETDDALGPRAAYGMTFPWLHLLDPAWAEYAAPRIFRNPADDDLPAVAWNAFIKHCPPYDVIFEILKDEYLDAIEGLRMVDEESLRLGSAESSVIEHLVHLFWRGAITLTEDDPLAVFFETASLAARLQFHDTLGRNIEARGRQQRQLKDDEHSRLQDFWNRRWAEIEQQDGDFNELTPIGWWLVSREFESRWCLDQLLKTIEKTGFVEPDYFVLDCLVEEAEAHPEQVLNIVSKMVENPRDQWFFSKVEPRLERVLRAVLISNDDQAVAGAESLVNRLASMGHLRFAKLLGDEDSE